MDLNRKYFEHQLALMLASSAENDDLREKHQADADGIGCRIKQFQQGIGASAAMNWGMLCAQGAPA